MSNMKYSKVFMIDLNFMTFEWLFHFDENQKEINANYLFLPK